MSPDIGPLLRPRSVAVLGASTDPAKLGGRVVANLHHLGPTATVHLVNPRGGPGTVPSLRDLPDRVDVVISAVPKAVLSGQLDAVEQVSSALVVLASGYGEVGDHEAQTALADLHARGTGVLGPNTVGLVNRGESIALTFSVAVQRAPVDATRGGLAIVTQSGAMGARLFSGALARGLPVSSFVGTGNEAGFAVADFLRDVARRGEVAGVLLHLENLRRWADIRAALEECHENGLPVSVLMGGLSEQGQNAAASHTGAMISAGGLIAQEVLTELGVPAVASDGELLDIGRVMLTRRRLTGPRLGLVSISGGAAVLLADQTVHAGLTVADFAETTRLALGDLLPGYVRPANPVDLTAAFLEQPDLMKRVVDTVAADPGIDGVVVYGDPGLLAGDDLRPETDKPVVGCITDCTAPAQGHADDAVPFFPDIGRAVRSLRGVRDLATAVPPGTLGADRGATAPEQPLLSEAMAWLGEVGIPSPPWARTRTVAQTRAAADRLWTAGGVVLKGDVGSHVHKVAAGALRMVRDRADLDAAAAALLDAHGAVVVQQLATGVVFEILCGVHDVEPFGPRLLVGWGGSWAEEIDRSTSRQLPVDGATVAACLAEVGLTAALTKNFGPDSTVVRDTAAVIQRLVDHGGSAGREINPVAVLSDGSVLALDIRFTN